MALFSKILWLSLLGTVATLSILLGLTALVFVVASIVSLLFCSAPFLPSFEKTVKKMLEFAQIKPGERVYDLGCGDGRLVFAAADQKAKATGIEVNFVFYYWALLRRGWFKKNGELKLGNLFDLNLHDADVIFCYLLPRGMGRLEEKIKTEGKKGCRIISHMFPFPGWKAEELFEPKEGGFGIVYKYVNN